ncbi:futalosine hydrolase [Mucilaginibacter sp. PPCGB 2223]|uniref:futalosine hydrolase n=1 Tax=Mucilaginibacter sp. PPCGB 2223 TaxID=1886027 RepID=UPI000824AE75|nr:futalosine hydrolase [Mucilaginibacter sp. PPCGB 2223]OCX50283.1 futalosine hydrolase [Mucilaginibacter sp. PPCGB 2223]
MQILIVAATADEISPLASHCGDNQPFAVLITGVGMVATAFALGRHLAVNNYDLVVNLGIAGSFDRSIGLGEVVEIAEDRIAELGAQDDEAFLSIEALGFGESDFYPERMITQLRKVRAITVNTVHGNEASIAKISNRLQPQLESMEGAAFFYACKQAGVAGVQIRAVSNYVEKRNRNAWKIGLAIKNLNSFAVDLLQQLLADDDK